MNQLHNKISLYSVLCILSALAVGLTSCKDFLNTPSQSSLSAGTFYQTPSDIDRALTGVYGALKPFSKYWFVMSEMRSDNMFQITEQKQNEYADCSQFNSSGLLNDNIVANCWLDHYILITAANMMLDSIDNVSFSNPSIREQYCAEARFLRALSYFDLVRFYGRVPVSLHSLSTSEAFNLGQSEDIDVYNKAIIPDLEYAVAHLAPAATDYKGVRRPERVSQTAAKALLGKVYMQMAGYPLYAETQDTAKVLLKQVLDETEGSACWVSSMDEWDRMWLHESDNRHFLFEIQYLCANKQGNPMTPLTRSGNNQDDNYTGANLTNGPHVYVERDLQDHFLLSMIDDEGHLEYSDKRMYWSINRGLVYDEETGTYTGAIEVKDGKDKNDVNNFMAKFLEHKMKRAQLGVRDIDGEIINYTYWPQNFPVLRIEDIALLYAECEGPTAEGYKYLNRIHTRAGLAPYSGLGADQFQEAVRQERRYELLGEGHRWFDQVRQNTYVEDSKRKFINYRDKRDANHSNNYTIYANRVTRASYLYPIPLSQIQVRDGLYQQNPGY